MDFKKSTIIAWLMVGVMATPIFAGSDKILLSAYARSVRMELNIATNNLLPDSVMIDMGSRGLVKTAAEAGGIGSAFWVTLVAGQMLYDIPDTVVELVQASIISNNHTVDIRSFVSQYFNEEFKVGTFDESSMESDDRPAAYSLWNDSLQIFPFPVNGDSIYFKCYVEHPVLTALTDTVYLKSDYQEAAKSYTMYLAYRRLQEYEVAGIYLADYKAQVKDLVTKHQPKLERLMVKQ